MLCACVCCLQTGKCCNIVDAMHRPRVYREVLQQNIRHAERERERERDKTNRTRMSRWSERVDSCQTPAAAITRVEARALGPIKVDRSGSGAPRPVTKPRRPRLTEVPSLGERALWTERRRGPTTVNAWTNHNFSDDVRASRRLRLCRRPCCVH